MMPSPTIRLLRPSKIDTVRPTMPSPPTPRLSLTSPVLELVTVSTKKECKIGLDEQAAAAASSSDSESESDQGEFGDVDNGCPYWLDDKVKGVSTCSCSWSCAVTRHGTGDQEGPSALIAVTILLVDSGTYWILTFKEPRVSPSQTLSSAHSKLDVVAPGVRFDNLNRPRNADCEGEGEWAWMTATRSPDSGAGGR